MWDELEEAEEIEDPYTEPEPWFTWYGKETYYGDCELFPGERVITPRLRENLDPLEEAELSGRGIAAKLYRHAYHLLSRREIQGWTGEDLVQYTLEEASKRVWNGNPAVLFKWMYLQANRLWKKADREMPTEEDVVLDRAAPEFPRTKMGDEWHTWLKAALTPRQYQVVCMSVELDMKSDDIAQKLGLSLSRVTTTMSEARSRITG